MPLVNPLSMQAKCENRMNYKRQFSRRVECTSARESQMLFDHLDTHSNQARDLLLLRWNGL